MDRGVEGPADVPEELRRSVRQVMEADRRASVLLSVVPLVEGDCQPSCGGQHEPMNAVDAVLIIRALYTAGVPYSKIADFTRLVLTHAQLDQLVHLPGIEDMAEVLAFFTS